MEDMMIVVDSDDGTGGSRRERAYKCQRCLNHNRLVSRKGHQCPYKDCVCSGCDLNNLRSKLMTVLRERGLNHSEVFLTKKSGRKQHCMLCSFHGERVELRGHKRNCPWAKCDCTLCTIGRHYRDTMAKQTKHRRSQRRSTSIDRSSRTNQTKREGSNGSMSKRTAMKRDWRAQTHERRSPNNYANNEIGPIDVGTKTKSSSNGSRSQSDIDTNSQSTTDRSSMSSGGSGGPNASGPPSTPPEAPPPSFVPLIPTTIWPPASTLGMPPTTNNNAFYNLPFCHPFNLLNTNSGFNPSPAAASLMSNMAAQIASHVVAQQRQANDLALAFLLSRYGSSRNSFGQSAASPAAACVNCHHPPGRTEMTNGNDPSAAALTICHQQGHHGLPKMDRYVNFLPTAGTHATLPTVLNPADAWRPTNNVFFFK